MIFSTILCCIAFFIFLLQLFRLKQGERFLLTATIQLMSCESSMEGGRHTSERRNWQPCHAGAVCLVIQSLDLVSVWGKVGELRL